jgi:hypothetical protein
MPIRRKSDDEQILYGRTPLGQLVYDLGFAKLKDATIARKHGMTLEQVRTARESFKRGFKKGKVEAGKATARRKRKGRTP